MVNSHRDTNSAGNAKKMQPCSSDNKPVSTVHTGDEEGTTAAQRAQDNAECSGEANGWDEDEKAS